MKLPTTTYRGNPFLKKVGVKHELTEDQVAEYIKCSNDPIYFIKKYMKIINVDRGLINFDLYDYQENIINTINSARNTIIATSRQAGKSTSTCGYLLWYIIFNPYKTVAVLANKGETAREILGKVKLGYEHLPDWLQHGIIEWNKGSIELENGSRIIADSTAADTARGYSYNLIFIDEAAHIENWEDFAKSVIPTISSGKTTKMVLVSTPNGLNHFWTYWSRAINGQNDYRPIKVMWYEVPGRDEEWREKTIRDDLNGDEEKFEQEYCVGFLGSSGTLIKGDVLKTLVHQPSLIDDEHFKVYVQPQNKHMYAIICDVSQGKGLDYSAFSVIDISSMPYKQVATYRNNAILPGDYTDVINQTGDMYNQALILIESNDMGQSVADSLHDDFEYENVVMTENAGREGKRMASGFRAGSTEFGVRTTKTVKKLGCLMLKMLVEQQSLIVNDEQTIEELKRFSKKNNSYEAEAGSNDDLVMGLVLFGWLSNQAMFKELVDIDTFQNLREQTQKDINESLSPFGFINDGHEDEEGVTEMDYLGNPVTVGVGPSWLS